MSRTVSTLAGLCALVALLFGGSIFFGVAAQAQTPSPSLRGTITDPSGSIVPGTLVQLIGPRGEQRQTAGSNGQYSFPAVPAGKYQIRFIAQGFSVAAKQDVDISAPLTLDMQLSIEANAQVVNVQEEANRVSIDPAENGDALVLGDKQLDALSDDPDLLQQQLLALAGPGSGPNGGQITVDGFTGAQLPPKSSIQEIRINSNPYSPENEYAGGSGVQIITKPGTSTMHGGFYTRYNKEALNSRNPLLTEPKRPQYKQVNYSGNVSGRLIKNKLSYSFFFNRNEVSENAFIYAATLDSNLNPVQVNQSVPTPRGNWNWSPRFDFALNSKNTLTVSYFNGHNHADNLGVGDFALESRGYNNHGNNNQIQVSETAVLTPHLVSDTRFQWYRNLNNNTGDNSVPSLVVSGAFSGGGAQVGNSGAVTNSFEFNSSTSYGYRTHTFRWGGRMRASYVDNTSVNNFGGTYTFQGGTGPILDSADQPIPGTSVGLTALEVYRRTLLFQQQGMNDAEIRQRGGGAYQFSLSAGQPTISLHQYDWSFFFVDDWRAKPNLTFSYGLRYETQTNISDHADWAPRVAVAWNVGTKPNKPGKTVLRAGAGVFYNRLGIGSTLNAMRYDGVNQQSYVILAPFFFPLIPSAATLEQARQPQQIQIVDSAFEASRTYQASVGMDRQISKPVRLSVNYVESRGVHQQRTRNINAPVNGAYPFGDQQVRMLTEGTGFTRTRQLNITPSINYKKMFLAGYYTLSYGKSDAEGQPADPYNLRAEWGPSTWGDTRHRVAIVTSIPLPWKFTLTPQFSASSGAPYNITAGRDLNGDTIISERPSLLPGVSAANCAGGTLIYKPDFGCFNVDPAPGTAIGRNFARGPASVNIVYAQLSRNWILGAKKKETAAGGGTTTVSGPGGTTITAPTALVGGPNTSASRTYTLNFSIAAQNPLNHVTYAPPSGDLSSPYFGVYRSITSGGNTFNRQISLQLRLSF
jgi:hypothetical protein